MGCTADALAFLWSRISICRKQPAGFLASKIDGGAARSFFMP
jgi:hypothetical protein